MAVLLTHAGIRDDEGGLDAAVSDRAAPLGYEWSAEHGVRTAAKVVSLGAEEREVAAGR